MSFTNADLARCAERELEMRRRVYPDRVAAGRMTSATAARECALMQQIAHHFRALADADAVVEAARQHELF